MLFLIIAYVEHGIANKTNTERMKGYVIKYLSLPIHLSRKKSRVSQPFHKAIPVTNFLNGYFP